MSRRSAVAGLLLVGLLALADVRPAAGHGDEVPTVAPPWASAQEVAPPVPCYGDGVSGRRVEVLYLHAPGQGAFTTLRAAMREAVENVDAMFNASAQRSQPGTQRHVRWHTDANCNVVLRDVTLPASVVNPPGITSLTEGSYFRDVRAALRSRGFDDDDRKYLAWADSPRFRGCNGKGTLHYDEDPTAANLNNNRVGYALVSGACLRRPPNCEGPWGTNSCFGSVEGHELMHNLGGVVRSAPHRSAAGHCTDNRDRMCYDDDDGGPVTVTVVCTPNVAEWLFDCNHDDYFRTAPDTPYFAGHWNTADSGWLETEAADPRPVLTGISPRVGPVAGGQSVTLTGSGFPALVEEIDVVFGTTSSPDIVLVSPTEIVAAAPPRVAGPVDVRVTTPGGTSSTSAATTYTYVATPTVTGLSPAAGPASGGTQVVLTGTGFAGVTQVAFGATPTATFRVNGPTSITATSPAGALGPVNVRVTTPGGTSATAPANVFTYRRYRPDLLLRRPDQAYVGNGVYNTTGAGQGLTTNARRGTTALFDVRVENDGDVADRYVIQGTGSGYLREVRYRYGDTYITSAVVAGTYTTPTISPGSAVIIRLSVAAGNDATIGLTRAYPVTVSSVGSPGAKDRVVPSVTVVAS